MANSRDIKRRIKSVANTSKITRTMELIATAKSQVCMGRIRDALPYFQALEEIASEATRGGDVESHALLEQRDVKRVAVLGVVANRGLCGGYNGNCMRRLRDHRRALLAEGKEVLVLGSGKKGLGWLRFQKIAIEEPGYTQFEDKPAFTDVEEVANRLIGLFLNREVDRVDVVYTHYYSAGRQEPVVETMLPISPRKEANEAAEPKAGGVDFLIEPDPASILDALFPLQARLHLYRIYLEAATSEQIARRVAMKNATENASEVGRDLKMAYNRARQSQITNEILEVLGGAEALK